MFYFDIPLMRMNFQNPCTPICEGIIDLHHHICNYLLYILIVVCWILIIIIKKNSYDWNYPTIWDITFFRKEYLKINNFIHGTLLEIIWTVIPSILLIFIAFPSFALLYALDIVIDPKYTIKVIGHQWYWTYESSFQNSIDSYMLPIEELEIGV